MPEHEYMVWSHERAAWYGPPGAGDARSPWTAGRFTEAGATGICDRDCAGWRLTEPDDTPPPAVKIALPARFVYDAGVDRLCEQLYANLEAATRAEIDARKDAWSGGDRHVRYITETLAIDPYGCGNCGASQDGHGEGADGFPAHAYQPPSARLVRTRFGLIASARSMYRSSDA
jgi:hypothetical protein